MENFERIDVIILNYNRKLETQRCIQSLIKWSKHCINNILVWENSTDLEEKLEPFEHSGINVKIYGIGKNDYVTKSRDFLIKLASTRLVCMIDNDAYVDRDILTPLISTINSCDSAIVQPGICDPLTNELYGLGISNVNVSDSIFLRANYHGCMSIVNRSKYFATAGFPHEYEITGEEGFLSLEFFYTGETVLYVKDLVVLHEKSPKGRDVSEREINSIIHRNINFAINAPLEYYLLRVARMLFQIFSSDIDFRKKLLLARSGLIKMIFMRNKYNRSKSRTRYRRYLELEANPEVYLG